MNIGKRRVEGESCANIFLSSVVKGGCKIFLGYPFPGYAMRTLVDCFGGGAAKRGDLKVSIAKTYIVSSEHL